MQESDIPRYRVIVSVSFINIFGLQQSFERVIHLIIAHLNFPIVGLHDKIVFFGDQTVDFEMPNNNSALDEVILTKITP